MGDLNARTGTLEGTLTPSSFTDCNNEIEEPLNEYANRIPARNNSDPTLNANVKPFIELLHNSGLIILNGKTIGNIFGKPSCILRNGVSVVDYLCNSFGFFNKVRYFKVGPLSQYSDHRPLSLALSIDSSKSLVEDIRALCDGISPRRYPTKGFMTVTPVKTRPPNSMLLRIIQLSKNL